MSACHACGSELSEQQRFCLECGAQNRAFAPSEAASTAPIHVPYIPKRDPNIGKVISERYEITNIVGNGFYSAIDHKTTHRLTIRLFYYERFSNRDELTRRFESQRARNHKLDHPSVARMRSIHPEEDFLAITLDHSGQATLQKYLWPHSSLDLSSETYERRQLPYSKRLLKTLLALIFDGVSAMHDHGQVNGYLVGDKILIGEGPDLSGLQIKLCPFGTRKGSASHIPDRFHYDDERLTPAADVWYLGTLIRHQFHHLVIPFQEELAPVLKQATLESRTNRIQTLDELRARLAPIFETEWSDEPLDEFDVG